MKRITVDFGIDLGTTNSTIAVMNDTIPEPIPNRSNSVVTPSAIWIDTRDRLHVGTEAKVRALTSDPDNGDVEFKLRMGMGADGKKVFKRSGREMLPEELSAEVLKSLKTDVQTNLGENIQAAVITVPAAFELPQTDATRRAACGRPACNVAPDSKDNHPAIAGAGFKQCIIVQEPVAASLAYGFQSVSDKVYWLVYDFGGGTFDTALMRVRDGLIQVANHDGDNQLGGKLIDWDIVTNKLIPALQEQFKLPDFRRGNPKWSRALGRLKHAAEEAKIEVCRTRGATELWVDDLCEDAEGTSIDFSYNLTPEDLIEISKPYVNRSLGLCRKVLKEEGIAAGCLEKILMVGGTTLNPWIRETVAESLGAPLDFSIDPITVVARGAAVFAATQLAPETSTEELAGQWRVEIKHDPVGNVVDPDIAGMVLPPEDCDIQGYTIEFVDTKTKWRSGKLSLEASGTFETQLFAEEKRRCEFKLELCDTTGTIIPVSPDRVVYTLGIVPDRPPLSSSIGVGLANNVMNAYLKKGVTLPATKRHDHHSTVTLRAGHADDVLRIPILEGEKTRATRNHYVGELVIRGSDIHRSLPAGSKIEVTVTIDESQDLSMEAYIPILDKEFPICINLQMRHRGLDELRKEAKEQEDRLQKAREKLGNASSELASSAIARIKDEDLVIQVVGLIDAAAVDAGALQQLDRRLRDLAAAIDDIEDAAKWPECLKRAEYELDCARTMANRFGEPEEKDLFQKLERELERSIKSGELTRVENAANALCAFDASIRTRQFSYHISVFNHLSKRQGSMSDIAHAKRIMEQAQRAIQNNDIESLKAANSQLLVLLRECVTKEEFDPKKGTII
jgi:molecular chaperone DnaK